MRNALMVLVSIAFLSLIGCDSQGPEETADDVASATSAVEEVPAPAPDNEWWVFQNCVNACNGNWTRAKGVCAAYYPSQTGEDYWHCLRGPADDYHDCYSVCREIYPPGETPGGVCLPQLPGCGI